MDIGGISTMKTITDDMRPSEIYKLAVKIAYRFCSNVRDVG